MESQVLSEVLEATGYMANGQPAPGVYLDEEAHAECKTRDFLPDALWRSDSELTVFFKGEPELPSEEEIARWRREIWNQGFAPLLWVVSPQRIDLYNGFGQPLQSGDASTHRLRTFQKIESELDELDVFAGRLAMETGRFWQQADNVNRSTSVDRRLLFDLSVLESDLLKMGLDRSGAQGLIGRSIFTQYLIDRRIVTKQILKNDYSHESFPAILRDPSATDRLFNWLREVFNGDMFPSEGDAMPDAEHLSRVADFLDAVNPETRQMTLFPYQFDVIPIELISSIYEQFAHADPSTFGSRSGKDVFYTRLSLVSLVMDEIKEGLTGEESVLDLTCGSGVFLVEALRRLVVLRSKNEGLSRELIRSTLHQQIYGVDISEAAVRVAAFSLYLAALELDPNPDSPQTLKFEPLIGKTLFVGDAWDDKILANGQSGLTARDASRKFDVIVGNPPWSYRGSSAKSERRARGSGGTALPPRGESLDFVFRAMDFATKDTRFGLILSAVQFFSLSRTGASASRQIIEELSPVTLVNLSNQSDWLFPRSNMPAVVFFARHRPLRPDAITAVQVPWSPAGAQSHTFEIARSNIITLPLADWQGKPAFLKAAVVGFRRDLSLLDRLTDSYPKLGDQLAKLGTEFNVGLTFGNRSRDARFLKGLPFLTAGDLRPFFVSTELGLFDADNAQWPRSPDIYKAPVLLIKEFLRRGPRPIAAVVNQDVIFTDAFFGAALPHTERDTLHLLATILSSSLASWFFLMTSSTFGLWMQRIKLRDIERMPAPDLKEALNTEIGRYLVQLARDLQAGSPSVSDWQNLDEAVFDLYEMDTADRVVARDGLFRASWQWKAGRIASVEAANVSQLSDYARNFVAAIGVWLSAAKKRRMRAEVYELPDRAPLRVVRFILEERSKYPDLPESKTVRANGDLKDVIDRVGERLEVPLTTNLIGQRELRVHGRDEVVIIKPASRRHWMGVSALEDADSVIAESLSGTTI